MHLLNACIHSPSPIPIISYHLMTVFVVVTLSFNAKMDLADFVELEA